MKTKRANTATVSTLSPHKDTKIIRYCKPKAVRQLEENVFLNKQIKHPNIPINLLSKEAFRDDKANGLTKCIITFIQLKGGQAERINTTGRPIDRTQTYTDVVGITRTIGRIEWIKGTATNGSADISATIKGRSVKIEVKIGADRQSQTQKDYQQAIEKAGGLYYIAKDFTSFIEWYSNTFEL
jgi:hypothetical protein